MDEVIPRGTIYDLDPWWGYKRIEARNITHGTERVAQYRNTVFVWFTPRGKRKQAALGGLRKPSIVVLDGWGHPDLGTGTEVQESSGAGPLRRVEKPRYEFGSEKWELLFSSELDEYLERTGARILVDYRGHVVETIPTPEDPEVTAILEEIENRLSARAVEEARSKEVALPVEVPSSLAHLEGSTRMVLVNAFERNRAARQACIRHYGSICFVCGFRFENQYGPLGSGFIEVHHLVPLSDIRETYQLDPVKDLRPVCSNCHSMLHRRSPPLTPDELRGFISDRAKDSGQSSPESPASGPFASGHH